MQYAKVTAIVRAERLRELEERMIAEGAEGMSVTEIRGCGELKDFYKRDWLVSHARIEIFARESDSQRLAQAIMDVAHTGDTGDGVVAVLPVSRLWRIRDRSEVVAEPRPSD